ncbi:MAG: SPFH/Band 7/PHB domain protein [Planctomycetota bacterium]|nr:MAG: SPFH/Band 7/PHB domain protein [Planctomycetota bacterium]
MEGIIVVFIFIVILLFVFISKGIKIVRQAEVMIIERFGKFQRVLDSGLHFIIPFMDQPRKINWKRALSDYDGTYYIPEQIERIDLREIVYDFPRQNVITKDNVSIEINGLVYFQITDPKKAAYEINNLPEAIEKLTQTTLRSLIGDMELDECLSEREKINTHLCQIIDEATDKWGVKVNRVELQDINPPEDIRTAMEKQMRAERDRRAKILEAEGDKKSAILQAEGKKEAAVRAAEGEKEAKVLHAKGVAEAIAIMADAEAQAIEKVSKALGGASDPASYLIAIKYIEAMKEIGDGDKNKLVFMPYEATSMLGSLGSIKEIFQKTVQG